MQKNHEIPLIGLGTSRLIEKECEEIIKLALEIGYTHIDTAPSYGNHIEIAKGLKGSNRDSLFITTKYEFSDGDIKVACDNSLKDLNLDYLDLYLIHWPDRSYSFMPTLKKMEELKSNGKINRWGVSNFTIHHLEDMLALGYRPYCNQVEFHPYLYQKDLLDFCIKEKIKLISYRPLGKGVLISDPVVCDIAKNYQKTPSQILLKWNVQNKIPVLVKSTSRKHLEENLNLFDFSLKDEDIKRLNDLHQNKRFCLWEGADFDY